MQGMPFDFPGSPFEDFFKQFRRQYGEHGQPQAAPRHATALGSGFIIDPAGYVVTNNHVVADGTEYSVVLNDGTELDAKLIGADPRTDLAVLKVDADREFTYVSFADDSKVRVGDWVVAVGNPFGLDHTVTAGIVSATGRDIGQGPYDDFIQTDAAINPGNSGGALVDINGRLVGVNTAIYSRTGGSLGIGFAVPVDTINRVVPELIQGLDNPRLNEMLGDMADELRDEIELVSTQLVKEKAIRLDRAQEIVAQNQ